MSKTQSSESYSLLEFYPTPENPYLIYGYKVLRFPEIPLFKANNQKFMRNVKPTGTSLLSVK